MMKIIPKLKKAGSAFLAALLLLLSLSVPALAISPISSSPSVGSITINMSGTGAGTGSSGIKFTLYKVADLTGTSPIWYTLTSNFTASKLQLDKLSTASSSTVAATAKNLAGYVSSNNVPGFPLLTDSSGSVKFSGLSLGYYLVVPDQSPKSQANFCDPFLFTLPMASADGSSWIYDIIANTKCEDQAGAVILKKVNSAGSPLYNAVFRLDKKIYFTDSTSVPTGYQTFTDSGGSYFWNISVSELTTNSNGQLSVTGMAFGDYRFVETTPPSGYVLDSTPHAFTISAAGTVSLVNGSYVPTSGSVQTVTVINYPPNDSSSPPHHHSSSTPDSSSFPPDSSPSSVPTSSLPDNSIPKAPPTESIPDENVPKSGFDLPKTGGSIAYGLCTYGGIFLAVCGALTFILSRKKKT